MKQDKAYIEMQVTDAPLSEQEFEELVKRMRPQLMRMGREFFGSEMEAEEVVQETWLRVWNVRHSATVTEALVICSPKDLARSVCEAGSDLCHIVSRGFKLVVSVDTEYLKTFLVVKIALDYFG